MQYFRMTLGDTHVEHTRLLPPYSTSLRRQPAKDPLVWRLLAFVPPFSGYAHPRTDRHGRSMYLLSKPVAQEKSSEEDKKADPRFGFQRILVSPSLFVFLPGKMSIPVCQHVAIPIGFSHSGRCKVQDSEAETLPGSEPLDGAEEVQVRPNHSVDDAGPFRVPRSADWGAGP